MAGGMYSRRGPGAPLGERTGPEAQGARNPESECGPAHGGEVAVTPCWFTPGARLPASVLAWRRDPAAGWQALVAAWVPADQVEPRDP
jgi:hypothetical protein